MALSTFYSDTILKLIVKLCYLKFQIYNYKIIHKIYLQLKYLILLPQLHQMDNEQNDIP